MLYLSPGCIEKVPTHISDTWCT